MPRKRFEDILHCLQLSHSPDPVQQFLDHINAVNKNTKKCICSRNICSSGWKRDQIVPPQPTRKNENNPQASPHQQWDNEHDWWCHKYRAMVLELYEGREIISQKAWVKELRATTSTVLRLTKDLHSSGRIVIADSWFWSVKSAMALRKHGLYCNMLVKTDHKVYPHEILGEIEYTAFSYFILNP